MAVAGPVPDPAAARPSGGAVAAPWGAPAHPQESCAQAAGLRWEVELRPGPEGLAGCELVSTIENCAGRGVALPCWGPAPGLQLHLATPAGLVLFDAGARASGGLAVLPAGERWVAHVPLARRPLVVVQGWRDPPVRRLLGLEDPWLEREEHLWMEVQLRRVGGPALAVPHLEVPLAGWRRGTCQERSPWLLGDMARLTRTELVYRPGRLLVGFGADVPLARAKAAVAELGHQVESERFFDAAQVLSVGVERGREQAAEARFQAHPAIGLVAREPILSGPLV